MGCCLNFTGWPVIYSPESDCLLGRSSNRSASASPHSGHDFLVSSQNTGSWQGRRFMWPVTNWPKQVPRQLGINLWHFPTDHEARLKTTKRRLLLMIIMKKNNSIAKLLLGGVNHLLHALAASCCHCCCCLVGWCGWSQLKQRSSLVKRSWSFNTEAGNLNFHHPHSLNQMPLPPPLHHYQIRMRIQIQQLIIGS